MKTRIFPVRNAEGIIGHIEVPVLESWADVRRAQEFLGWSKEKMLDECEKAFLLEKRNEFVRNMRR